MKKNESSTDEFQKEFSFILNIKKKLKFMKTIKSIQTDCILSVNHYFSKYMSYACLTHLCCIGCFH